MNNRSVSYGSSYWRWNQFWAHLLNIYKAPNSDRDWTKCLYSDLNKVWSLQIHAYQSWYFKFSCPSLYEPLLISLLAIPSSEMENIRIVRVSYSVKENSATIYIWILLIRNCSSISLTLDPAKIAFKLKFQLKSYGSSLLNKYWLSFVPIPIILCNYVKWENSSLQSRKSLWHRETFLISPRKITIYYPLRFPTHGWENNCFPLHPEAHENIPLRTSIVSFTFQHMSMVNGLVKRWAHFPGLESENNIFGTGTYRVLNLQIKSKVLKFDLLRDIG